MNESDDYYREIKAKAFHAVKNAQKEKASLDSLIGVRLGSFLGLRWLD